MSSFRSVLGVGAGVLSVGLAFAAISCGDDYKPTTSSSSSGSGGASGTTTTGDSGGGGSAACDPKTLPSDDACVVTDELGIFVRVDGNDANAGTMQKPLATLQAAVDKAAAEGKRVYACGESFSQHLSVPAGVEIYGALACASGWAYDAAEPTELNEPEGSADPPLQLQSVSGTKLFDLVINAADKTDATESSIAVVAEQVEASFVRCRITAGKTVSGVDGEDASSDAATTGELGKKGDDADCQSSNVIAYGGASVSNANCPSTKSGKGGDGGLPSPGGNGEAGLPASSGGGIGFGQGLFACTSGGAGAVGAMGDAGDGASGNGSLGKSGYDGVSGADGKAGGVAQAGGGGGKAPPSCGPDKSVVGAAGGSGGGGGCGGAPGKGGGWAGSSIALLSLASTITLTDSVLIAGAAGDGGQGGDGQPGGDGGEVGAGGKGYGSSVAGCDGGLGGKGGDGGNGGGGSGGHSLAIAYLGTAPTVLGAMSLTPSAAGKGGLGGNASNANKGADGTAAAMLAFD